MVSAQTKADLQVATIELFDRHSKMTEVNALRHLYFGGFYSNPIEQFSVSEDFTRAVAGANKVEISFVGAVGRFGGGVLLPNGRVFCIPHNSAQHMTVDPDNHSLTLAGNFVGTNQWMGGAVGSNGRAFCAPFNATQVLEHNPGVGDTLFGNYSGTGKWNGLVPAPNNGSLYAVPFNHSQILRIIPTTRAVSLINITNPGSVNNGKWRGGCYVPSLGAIVCAPFNHPGALVIYPATGTAEVQNLFPSLPQGAFSACVLWRDGNVYFIPYNADAVYVGNPQTGQITKFGKLPLGGQKWLGGRIAPNGLIYCVPYDHPAILEIDPVNQRTRFIGNFEGNNKWAGGVLTQYGNLFTIPYSAEDALSILGTRMSGPDWWNLSTYTNIF